MIDFTTDNTERILAIDYGEKRIGVAISDPLKMFATPLETLANDHNFWKNFDSILSKYNVLKIIIGLPLKEDGTDSKITKQVTEFADKVKKKTKIDIEFIDERFSSAIAWEQILESVPSKKKRRDKSLIDKNAAAVILNDYLKSL